MRIKVTRIGSGISPFHFLSNPISFFLYNVANCSALLSYNQFYLSFITHAQPWHDHFIRAGSWRLPRPILETPQSPQFPSNYHQSGVPIPGAGTGAALHGEKNIPSIILHVYSLLCLNYINETIVSLQAIIDRLKNHLNVHRNWNSSKSLFFSL